MIERGGKAWSKGGARTAALALALGATLFALAACGGEPEPAGEPVSSNEMPSANDGAQGQPLPPVTPVEAVDDWQLILSEDRPRLYYQPGSEGLPVAILTCLPGNELRVRLPRVAPIGSEERLSVGSGQRVTVLVADPDGAGPGIAGEGPVESDWWSMLADGFAATYGAYSSGVLPPVPAERLERFRAACG